ncbi:hypothetical protein GCM10023220_00470 [Streptomyces ziwulingensis]|uniref:Uncharacterized protein n=1 Tax=Streptomyces ziwulingensis TaxID=1045501 RepID=A0ABP9AJS2_9ACTN
MNMLAAPDSEREAAQRYLARLTERARRRRERQRGGRGPDRGSRPRERPADPDERSDRPCLARRRSLQGARPGEEAEPLARLGETADFLSQATLVILRARNHAARTAQQTATTPPPPSLGRSPATRPR